MYWYLAPGATYVCATLSSRAVYMFSRMLANNNHEQQLVVVVVIVERVVVPSFLVLQVLPTAVVRNTPCPNAVVCSV